MAGRDDRRTNGENRSPHGPGAGSEGRQGRAGRIARVVTGWSVVVVTAIFGANLMAAAPRAPLGADEAAGAAGGEAARLGVVVDLSERQLDVRVEGDLRGTYQVAVGQPGHRTPTGTYGLSRVVWNPDWVPPDSEWAEDAERAAPDDPDNPMGDVKIYFTDLLYIHGTDATGTLGEPESHGCIRMRNEDAKDLARLVMEHGGADRADAWIDQAARNDADQHTVEIPDPPTLRITE